MRSWVEAVYSCIGNCIAAQQQSISFICLLPLRLFTYNSQPSRMAGKIRYPWASQVWPVEPSSARHEVGRPMDDARRVRQSHEPGDMVPRADAKMQIPSCQMRFGACWPGCFDRRWVRS